MTTGNISLATSPGSPETGVLDIATRNIIVLLSLTIFGGLISLVGIVFNAINVVAFVKQGFKDTVNITLFGLAISDLGVLVTFLWGGICYNPLFINSGHSFDPDGLCYLTCGWPSVCFARITSWITAFVTFERCMCIAMPLKVKTIITPKRTVFVVVGIFLTMFANVVPVYCSISLGPTFFRELNKTMIGMVFIPNGETIEKVALSISIFSQFASFFVVIVCTVVLILNLIRKSKWRQSTSSSAKQKSVSNRDKKVVKMILSISIIFIACFLPSGVNFIVIFFLPEYKVTGKYQNLFISTWCLCKALGTLNSSVNIFVYYNMSSKFKEIVDKMFPGIVGKKETKKISNGP
ncbi:cysteinyl leukotriene receptor 1-like [Aplysia californica]|uniref:Cysteinyl leukotriene receptor 1-like n=1 Tax=Aplysia californica TaxID=6500 RepID=A0ABM1A7C1_APLCA|nr:cysteinyl leukotriene receptor 1-like [Aplysia californica]